jgi:hypothetical protein
MIAWLVGIAGFVAAGAMFLRALVRLGRRLAQMMMMKESDADRS